jgi:hypothetical protein
MKTADDSPETISGESPESDMSPDRPRRRGLLLLALGIWLVLLGVVGVVVAGSFDEEPTVELIGRDAPVNASARSAEDVSAHNSPNVARNPQNPANLAVADRIDTPFFSCALHISRDSGSTWTQTAVPAPKGEEAKCFRPDVEFAADGTLFLAFVTLGGRGNTPHALWTSKSTDGGRTLSTPVRVHGRLTFQTSLAADPRNPRRVFLTWLQGKEVGVFKFAGPGNPILASRSDDGGSTWSKPAPVNSATRGRVIAPAPIVGRDGNLYVLHLDLGNDRLDYEGGHRARGGPPYDGRFELVMARSRDGLTGWEESKVADGITPIERFIVFLAPGPSVAMDDDGRIYAAFHDARLGDADVWLWSFEPGASTWEGPRRVNDNRRRDGTAQYLPALAVAPDGRLDVLYYDRRLDRTNVLNNASLQSSFDHGKTFTPAIKLSSKGFDSRIGFGAKEGLPDLGSRLALISDNRSALAAWTDTRAGTPETQKQDIARAVVSVSDPTRLSDTTESLLRYGGLAVGLAGLLLAGMGLGRMRAEPA